jgi:hypothetical protein
MRRSVVLWLAVVLASAACGSPSESASVEPSGPTASLPLDPATLGLTCDGATRFHPALLAEPGQAETEPDPAAAALRAYLGGPDGQLAPRSGWIRVWDAADEAQFIAPTADAGEWHYASFELRAGALEIGAYGSCRPEIALGQDLSRADVRLDPAFPAPDASATAVHLLINERACSGGRSPEGRVEPPLVTTTSDSVIIAIVVRQIPGGNDCPSNPDFAVTVELPAALGGRQLLDGAVFPPAPIVGLDQQAGLGDTDVDCGPVERVRCAALAREIVERTELTYGVGVLWLRITDDKGSHRLGLPGGVEITEGVD